jgi:hypothetical protein
LLLSSTRAGAPVIQEHRTPFVSYCDAQWPAAFYDTTEGHRTSATIHIMTPLKVIAPLEPFTLENGL